MGGSSPLWAAVTRDPLRFTFPVRRQAQYAAGARPPSSWGLCSDGGELLGTMLVQPVKQAGGARKLRDLSGCEFIPSDPVHINALSEQKLSGCLLSPWQHPRNWR